MKRRDVIMLVGAAALAWPLGAGAQDTKGIRIIGILMPFPQSDANAQKRIQLFRQELARLGWSEGRNVKFVEYWSTDDMDVVRADAASLVAVNPDVILTMSDRVTPVFMKLTSTISIVIAGTSDPIATGAAESLARPGHNVTGFSLTEFSILGKLTQILTQMAPGLARVGLLYNPDNQAAPTYQRWFAGAAAQLGVQPINLPMHNAQEIERAIAGIAAQPNSGIITAPDLTAVIHRKMICDLAARHRLPAVYSSPQFPKVGGLAAYGADVTDAFPKAAGYVDRILRGAKASDLAFQQPTVYRFILNLKAAKALGITVPTLLLAAADEVIE
jgi:putative tryptophan/tyrosine transport system substrate-binding protein